MTPPLLQPSFPAAHYTPAQVVLMFASYIRERGYRVVNAKIMRDFCTHHDCTPYGYQYVLRHARDAKLIKLRPDGGWDVTIAKP